MNEEISKGMAIATLLLLVIVLVISVTFYAGKVDLLTDCKNYGKINLTNTWYECSIVEIKE